MVCRAGVKLPTVTVCFKDLDVSTTVYVGSRSLPSTLNAYRNFIEVWATLRSPRHKDRQCRLCWMHEVTYLGDILCTCVLLPYTSVSACKPVTLGSYMSTAAP